MTVGEGLRGFIEWPISRKVVLLGSGGLLASIGAGLVNALLFSLSYPSAMDLGLLNRFIAVWIVAQALITALALRAARRNAEGRWEAYVFVSVQAPFIAGLLYLYGTMNTPLVAIYPAIAILWTLLLDERIGIYGLVNLVLWIALAGWIEASGLLPFAPMLLERSIDAQNHPAWFSAVFFHILVLATFCVSLSILFQRTRRAHQARVQQAHTSLERANALIRRYIPAPVAERISSGEQDDYVRPQRRKLTIVSVGIDHFLTAAEDLEAEELAEVLDTYLSSMVSIADQHGGIVNHVLGDGMLILFGAPEYTDDAAHAMAAVRMAEDMQARVAGMRDMWSRHGLDRPFCVRIGINTGYVSVGDFGSSERKLYSGIGLQLHVAESIQRHCPPGRILLSHSSWLLVQPAIGHANAMDWTMDPAAAPQRAYLLGDAAPPEPAPHAAPRSTTAAVNHGWRFGRAHFDEDRLILSVDGQAVTVERKPQEVLRYLLRHAGSVVTKDALHAAVWPGRIPSETVIAKCISRLREVLQDEGQQIIKTVHGYGYRLVAEVRPEPSDAAPAAASAGDRGPAADAAAMRDAGPQAAD
jgi:class 3 adenylate cyclase/DNA-binding winged helix-turn-helix (wHTH) protein